jgi:hypothetical protein
MASVDLSASNSNDKSGGGSSSTQQLCVGVFDRQTRTLTVHPAAAGGAVLAMAQSVPSYAQKKTAAASTPTSNGVTAQQLFRDFGSSKKQKALRSQAANRLDADSVVGGGSMKEFFATAGNMSESNRLAAEKFRQSVQAGGGGGGESSGGARPSSAPDFAADAAADQWRRQFLPPHDEQATKARNIYDVKRLVGDEVWEQAGRVARAVLSKADNACDKKQQLGRIMELLLQTDSKEGEDKQQSRSVNAIQNHLLEQQSWQQPLRCTYILHHWCSLYLKLHRRRSIPRPAAGRLFFGVPAQMAVGFVETFCTELTPGSGGYVMSKRDKDRCLVHLLLLYVLIVAVDNDSSLLLADLRPVVTDLKLDSVEASKLLREAGCTCKKQKDNKIQVVLKVPLTFPAVKKRKRSGQGR